MLHDSLDTVASASASYVLASASENFWPWPRPWPHPSLASLTSLGITEVPQLHGCT